MLQENIAVRNPVVCLTGFGQVDVAASQTDAQLTLWDASVDGIVMPKAGYVIGLGGTLSAAASAGSMTVGVTIDGTEDTDTTQTITTAAEFYDTFKTGDEAVRFAAGEQIGVEITTDGSWNATTSELAAQVYVVFEDWDF